MNETGLYLRCEAMNFANFVFDSSDLNTARGGSLMLLDLSSEVEAWANEQDRELEIISKGASVVICKVLVREDNGEVLLDVEDLRKSLDEHLLKKLPHATIAVDVLENDADQEKESWPRVREALMALNRFRQLRSPSIALPASSGVPSERLGVSAPLVSGTTGAADGAKEESGGHRTGQRPSAGAAEEAVGACSVDRLRPATERMTVANVTEVPVSAATKLRREVGMSEKRGKFYTDRTTFEEGSLSFTHTLDELTDDPSQGALHHKMALIYVDGNGFGAQQAAHCKSAERARSWDNFIRSKANSILQAILDRMVKDPSWNFQEAPSRRRIETLMWGGDDMMFIVPAWKGWEALELVFKSIASWRWNLTEATDKEDESASPAAEVGSSQDVQLRCAAGVVFCHHNADIRRIQQIARDLCGMAKIDREQNLIAYQVLESFDLVGDDLLRARKDRARSIAPEDLLLNAESLSALRKFVTKVRNDIPRGKLRAAAHRLSTEKKLKPSANGEAASERAKAEDVTRIIDAVIANLSAEDRQAFTNLSDPEDSSRPIVNSRAAILHMEDLWDYIPVDPLNQVADSTETSVETGAEEVVA